MIYHNPLKLHGNPNLTFVGVNGNILVYRTCNAENIHLNYFSDIYNNKQVRLKTPLNAIPAFHYSPFQIQFINVMLYDKTHESRKIKVLFQI